MRKDSATNQLAKKTHKTGKD